ncbi:MAG: element excision factor XisI family protein [Caldilineaceae bacterium]
MGAKTYPDPSPIFAAKAERRRQLAALSWEEKVAIIEQMRELMPRHGWRQNQPTPAAVAARLSHYRTIIKAVLTAYAQTPLPASAKTDQCEILPIFDECQDIYLVQSLCWQHGKPELTTPIRLRIQENQIWIEADQSQTGMISALTQAGIPANDLVDQSH